MREPETLLFRQLVENSFDSVWVLSLPHYELEYANKEVTEKLLGYPIESFYRDPRFWLSIVVEEDRALALRLNEECLRTGRAEARYRMVRKDGGLIWVLVRLHLIRDKEGNPCRQIGSSIDITALVNSERQRQRQLDSIHALLTGIDDIVFEITGECRFLECWCKEPRKLFLPKASFIGKVFAEVFPGDFSAPLEKLVARALESGEAPVVEYRDLSGADRWFSCRITPIFRGTRHPGDARLAVLISDITEKKKAAEALKKSEESFALIADLSPDIISIISSDGKLRFNSSAASRIHGYLPMELIGQNTLDLIHVEDRPGVLSALQELTRVPDTIGSVQYRYRNKDGSYSWMEAVASNQLANPEIRGLITISRDISTRKMLENDLREALEARDEFLSIASHELKTPLTSLCLQLQLIERLIAESSAATDQQIGRVLGWSIQACGKLNVLLTELLDITRIRAGRLTLKKQPVHLKSAVETAVNQMSEAVAKSGSSLKISASESVVGLWDPQRIEQVIVNLIFNAVKYGKGTPIEVTVKTNPSGDAAILLVRDYGIGISEDLKARLFQRFQRATQNDGISGLGLGLYIIRQIIEAHGGSIRVESTVGRGALFIVELPLGAIREGNGELFKQRRLKG